MQITAVGLAVSAKAGFHKSTHLWLHLLYNWLQQLKGLEETIIITKPPTEKHEENISNAISHTASAKDNYKILNPYRLNQIEP